MDWAVVKIGGKQFRVSEGDVIEVNRLEADKDKKVKFEEVLLTSREGNTKVGSPIVKNAKVTAVVLDNMKGKKIRVAKFKSKVRYRKSMGFCPLFTQLRIEKIEY